MTKQEIKAERLAIQRLIRASNKKLLSQIKRDHKKFVRLLKKRWQVDDNDLIDFDFYFYVESDL